MGSQNLARLAKVGSLKAEPADAREISALLKSGRARLTDARKLDLAIESRFDLAYNAAHAIALGAAQSRVSIRQALPGFQCLEHTLDVRPEVWRVLALSHERRNLAEYEGHLEIDEQLMSDLLSVTARILALADPLHAAGRRR